MSRDELRAAVREVADWIGQAKDEDERTERTLQFVSEMVRHMEPAAIEELRRDIVAELDPRLPMVAQALDMVEGAQALRAIGAKEGWR